MRLTCFTAVVWPVSQLNALYTVAKAPFPSTSASFYGVGLVSIASLSQREHRT